MDCTDRITGVLTEQSLEPVRLMRERTLLVTVALRAVAEGRRFNITIQKTWPAGSKGAAGYGWTLVEVDERGLPLSAGPSSAGEILFTDPEEAYWAANEAIAELV
ncbi:MAG TPA: hypothetical protein VFI42_04915 [Thermomicrobiaceae bacterium]|nr:hypothetical protein [Thermomicrobiaceae bacterium]